MTTTTAAPESAKPAVATWRTPAVIVLCGCLIALLTFGPRSAVGQFLTPAVVRQRLGPRRVLVRVRHPESAVGRRPAVRRRDRRPLRHRAGAVRRRHPVWARPRHHGLRDRPADARSLGRRPDRLRARRLLVQSGALGASASWCRRSGARCRFGAGTAAGSFGQFLFSPLARLLIDSFGWQHALLIFAAGMLLILPLSLALATPRGDARRPARRRRNRSGRRWRKRSGIAPMCCWCSASSPAASSSPSSPCICRPIWSIAASPRRSAAGPSG